MSYEYTSPQNNLVNYNPFSCSCHCYCHNHESQNNSIPDRISSTSQINSNGSNMNFYGTFSPNFYSSSINNSKNNINPDYTNTIVCPKRNNYFLSSKNSKSNSLFRKNSNCPFSMNDYTIKNHNKKCYNNLFHDSDFDLSIYNLGRKYLNTGKKIYFDSMDNNNIFNMDGSNHFKGKKFLFLNNDNGRLKRLLKKVPKHEGSYMLRSMSSPYFNESKNKKGMIFKNFFLSSRTNGRNNNNFKAYSTGKYLSFVLPANDLGILTRDNPKISF